MKVLLWLLIIPLTGCLATNRQENTHRVEVERHTGIVAGQSTDLVIKRESQDTTDAKASAGIDAETYKAGLAALASTLTGNYQGALDKAMSAMSAKPIDSGFGNAIEVGLGTLATTLLGTTAHQVIGNRRKRKELSELRREHIDVCKKLPPEGA